MTLIICPECNREISNKADACIYCGYPIKKPFALDPMERTTFDKLAALIDELPLNSNIVFSTEDPDELIYYKLQPCKYNVIWKTKLFYEKRLCNNYWTN